MEMETSSIVLLGVSCAVSFGLGRIFVHFRDKKRKSEQERAKERAAQALREQPPEAESRNKGKRRRQLQQLEQREQLEKKPGSRPR
ncbi:Transmembrane protein [Polaromonas hydrogenivorans]